MNEQRILITAATGATGQAAIRHLLKSGHQIRALAHRKDGRSEALNALGVEVVYGDLNDYKTVKTALRGVSAAYFCYPIAAGLVQATAQFAQASRESGVEMIVNMSQKIARADAVSHASFEHWLAERILEWSGVPVTHLRPPFFAEWMLAFSPMIRQGLVYAPFAQGKTAFIAAEDQGRVIAKLLTNPTPHIGRTYYLSGPEELSFQEAVEKAGKVLGKQITYQVVPFAAMQENFTKNSVKSGQNNALNGYAESNQTDGKGVPHVFQHLQAAHQDFEAGLFRGTSDDVEQITGTPPISIDQFIEIHRSAFI